MTYVDGFVIPVPKRNLARYRRMAAAASKVWMAHGALEFRETVGEDLHVPKGCGLAFPVGVRAKSGETIVFSWIVYRSRAHRDRVNAKVMKDPRIAAAMTGPMSFDVDRMLYGGFRVLVEAKSRGKARSVRRRTSAARANLSATA